MLALELLEVMFSCIEYWSESQKSKDKYTYTTKTYYKYAFGLFKNKYKSINDGDT